MSATAAEFAYNEKGWKTAYVVTDQIIAYTRSLSEYFLVHFEAIGGKILLEDTYTNGDNDFSAQLARLKALDEEPDVIFISSYGIDIALITKSLRESGITAPILGGDSYDDPSVWEALGTKFGSDIYFVTHTWMGSAEGHPDMPEFVKLYTDYHGSAPDTAFVATGWDTVMLFAQAAEIAGTTDGAAVAKALEDNVFNLLTGDLDYSNAADGHYPYKAAALVALTEGNPSFLGWRNPENPPAP
jgi:branched-chain amino acid transport system substrate-binding protein